jgi:colanic acid biosynthesis glycosyl transferase WcaI
MAERVKLKSKKPVYIFPNWANTKIFFPLTDKAGLKEAFGFNADVPLILYSGSIGEKQGLDSVLNVAENFKQRNKKIQFVICGSGPYKTVLEELAAEKQLDNLSFLPLQPPEKLNAFLNMANLHLIMLKANVAHHVMPSKLTTILSVGGLAIITANPEAGIYKMITENNIGLVCPAENTLALAQKIETALQTDNSIICKNARKYATEFLAIDNIMQHYKEQILTD